MDTSVQYRRFLPPLTSSSGKEKEAYVKNRHEELRLVRILEQLHVQEKVYLQLFQKEKQVVEGRRTKFCNRIKSLSLGQVSAAEGPRCWGKVAPEEKSVSDTSCLSLPRSYSMPNSMPLWGSESLTMRQKSTLIMEEMEEPDQGPSLPSTQVTVGEVKTIPYRSLSVAGQPQQYLKKSPLPTKDADLPKFLEECRAADAGKSEKSDHQYISSVKVFSANASYTEKIRHRPLSASSHNPKCDPSKCDYIDSSKPPHVDAGRSRPSSATNHNFISETISNDADKPESPCKDPVSNRPASASKLNHSRSRRNSEKVLRSLSVHDISHALKSYRHKKVAISAINDENAEPALTEKRDRRSSILRNSLKGKLRKNSFFDTHMVLKQELQVLDKKRMRQKLSQKFTIDDAIVVEKVRYRRCVQKLESFFNRMTQFNTDEVSSTAM